MKERKTKDLALYKGDEFVFLGNRTQIAEFMNINLATVWRWKQHDWVEYAQDNDEYYVIEVEDDE